MRTKSFKTDVLINDDKYPEDDLQFIRTKGLKPTNLLRAKIKELRAIDEGEPDYKMIISQRDRVTQHRNKLIEFINKHGLTEKMIEEVWLTFGFLIDFPSIIEGLWELIEQ